MVDRKSKEMPEIGAFIIMGAFTLFLYADIIIYQYSIYIIALRIAVILMFALYIIASRIKIKGFDVFSEKLYYVAVGFVFLFIDVLLISNANNGGQHLSRSIQAVMIIQLGMVLFADNIRHHISRGVLLNTCLVLTLQIVISGNILTTFFTHYNFIFFSVGVYVFNEKFMKAKSTQNELKVLLETKVDQLETQVAIQEMMEEELKKKASHDAMTGFLNRGAGMKMLQTYYNESVKNDHPLAVCYMDLNNLKAINDRLGHESGDQYILDFTEVVRSTVRNNDICVRMGGDEFLIILNNVTYENARLVQKKINVAIDVFNSQPSKTYDLSVSYGICERSINHTKDMKTLVACADELMFANKRRFKKTLIES